MERRNKRVCKFLKQHQDYLMGNIEYNMIQKNTFINDLRNVYSGDTVTSSDVPKDQIRIKKVTFLKKDFKK